MRGAALAVAAGGLRLVTAAGNGTGTARYGAPQGFRVQVARAAAGADPDWSSVPPRCSFARDTSAAAGGAAVLGGRARWSKCLKDLRFRGGQQAAATLYVRVRARAEQHSPYTVSAWSQPRTVALGV